MHLLLFLLSIILIVFALGGLGLLSSDTTRTSTTKGRAQGEIDVLLGIETNDEGGNIDDLLADSNVSLANKNTGVVNRLCETKLPDTGLQATLQEILNLQRQHVIELHFGFVKHS